MPATLVEKIFSERCSQEIHAGEVVMAPVDAAMIHDITGPLAIMKFREMGGMQVSDPSSVIMLFDHQVPADSIQAARNQVFMRDFAEEQGIKNYDIREGVCHQVSLEMGRIKPGDIAVGSDSHTCTYGAAGAFATGIGSTDMGFALRFGALYFRVPESIRLNVEGSFPERVGAKDLILEITGEIRAGGATYKSLEFTGETISEMEMPGRMTCCNMAIEMGAKTGMVPPDRTTMEYLGRTDQPGPLPDRDAEYSEWHNFDVSDLAPKVAVPHNVDNVVDVTEVEGTHIDQVFIGSCTNGRYEDFLEASEVLGDRKFAEGVRVILVPASRKEYLKCLRGGLIEKFVEAGGLVEAPCCGPCMGGAFGLLAPGEVSLSTSNRNFRGRQGSTEASVYLCSPATAAAGAIKGEITDPRGV